MLKPFSAFISLAALSACMAGEPLTFEATPIEVERWYAANFQDQPFDEGPISIVTAEHGEMRTYTLAACQGGTHICGARAGHLIQTPDYSIVTDAYHGRIFYLSPGGDGVLRIHGQDTTLAWEDAGPLPPERPLYR